jgi:hypothetical protein
MNKIIVIVTLALLFFKESMSQVAPPDLSANLNEVLVKKGSAVDLKINDSNAVFLLKFIGYENLDNYSLDGVSFVPIGVAKNGDTLFDRTSEKKYFQYKSTFLRDPNFTIKRYGIDRVGYKFQKVNYTNLLQVADTIVIFNFLSKGNYLQNYYSLRDYRNREANIAKSEKVENEGKVQKKGKLIIENLQNFKNKFFPNDSLYIFGVADKILRDREINTYLVPENNIQSISFAISNTRDLSTTEIVESNNSSSGPNGSGASKWMADSVFFYKAIPFNNLISGDTIFTLIGFDSQKSEDYNIDHSMEIQDVKKNIKNLNKYNNLEYWASKIDENQLANSTFTISLLPVNNSLSISIEEIVSSRNPRRTGSTIYKSNLPFFEKLDNNNVIFFNKKYDIRVDNLNYNFSTYLAFDNYNYQASELETNFYRHSNNPYGFDAKNTKRAMALGYYNEFMSDLGDVQEQIENQKVIDDLSKKYGATFVNEAINGNIIVQMPEDLLPVPLKFWKLSSRNIFKNGYSLYLYSILDSRRKLHVTVINHKVSSVSVW